MKKGTWRKQHKWLGIGMSFFMLMFCLSGVLLNHRSLIKDVNVSRSYLPSRYEFQKWNGGLLRGTIDLDSPSRLDSSVAVDSSHCILLYGNGGIWLTDSKASFFRDFNQGLPKGADDRQIRNIVKVRNTQKAATSEDSATSETSDDGILFAVSPFGLYRYGEHEAWHEVKLPLGEDEKLTDVASHGDTLVVLSRSFAYVSLPPYSAFKRVQLPTPKDYNGKVTAFRTVWLLHSGELFGMAGKLVVDAIAIVLVLLCITGFVFWLRPKRKTLLKTSLQLHDKIGRYTILLTLLIALTGWCLRPPVMIALVLSKIPALPGTTLKSENPWNDKLRMIRYDETAHDWLLSTSEGFYSLNLGKTKNLGKAMSSGKASILGTASYVGSASVKKITSAPPVSVMGLNVLQKDAKGRWLCGSFSGLFVWDRRHGISIDYFTGKPAPKKAGAPFGNKAIAGMSQDFSVSSSKSHKRSPVIAEYYEGTLSIAQPASMNQLPMSLWNVALEVHSGRIFIGSIATYVFIFVMGILAIWCLWSGYRIRLAKKKTAHRTNTT